jgi:hypothetical protein
LSAGEASLDTSMQDKMGKITLIIMKIAYAVKATTA